MNYSAGLVKGKWGGIISGAISSFRNDRPITHGCTDVAPDVHGYQPSRAELSADAEPDFHRSLGAVMYLGDTCPHSPGAPREVARRKPCRISAKAPNTDIHPKEFQQHNKAFR